MEELLNRLDELLIEAHNAGYTFVFTQDNEITQTTTMMYSADEGFTIDIEEW